MRECSRVLTPLPPQTILLRCPHCHERLALEDLQPGARLFDPVIHGLLDHIVHMQTELAAIKKLVEEVVL